MAFSTIRTRKEAKRDGTRHYFTGKPCRNGHVDNRFSCGICVSCSRESTKKWIDNNRETKRATDRNYRASNPEKLKKRDAEYYAANRERHNIASREYHLQNKEKVRASKRKRYAKNPDIARAAQARFRAANPEKITMWAAEQRHRKRRSKILWYDAEHKKQVLALYAEAREKTQKTGVLYHVDHIVPLFGKTVSGLHVPWNMRVIPARENQRKSNRLLDIAA